MTLQLGEDYFCDKKNDKNEIHVLYLQKIYFSYLYIYFVQIKGWSDAMIVNSDTNCTASISNVHSDYFVRML